LAGGLATALLAGAPFGLALAALLALPARRGAAPGAGRAAAAMALAAMAGLAAVAVAAQGEAGAIALAMAALAGGALLALPLAEITMRRRRPADLAAPASGSQP
jgi:hypothetical protein